MQVLQQEEYEFTDPVTQFLTCLYVDFDFEGAQQKLAECETVLENDFFLTALKVPHPPLLLNHCTTHVKLGMISGSGSAN